MHLIVMAKYKQKPQEQTTLYFRFPMVKMEPTIIILGFRTAAILILLTQKLT
jgi:hypothetical protein